MGMIPPPPPPPPLRTSSVAEACAKRGRDWKDALREHKKEIAIVNEINIRAGGSFVLLPPGCQLQQLPCTRCRSCGQPNKIGKCDYCGTL